MAEEITISSINEIILQTEITTLKVNESVLNTNNVPEVKKSFKLQYFMTYYDQIVEKEGKKGKEDGIISCSMESEEEKFIIASFVRLLKMLFNKELVIRKQIVPEEARALLLHWNKAEKEVYNENFFVYLYRFFGLGTKRFSFLSQFTTANMWLAQIKKELLRKEIISKKEHIRLPKDLESKAENTNKIFARQLFLAIAHLIEINEEFKNFVIKKLEAIPEILIAKEIPTKKLKIHKLNEICNVLTSKELDAVKSKINKFNQDQIKLLHLKPEMPIKDLYEYIKTQTPHLVEARLRSFSNRESLESDLQQFSNIISSVIPNNILQFYYIRLRYRRAYKKEKIAELQKSVIANKDKKEDSEEKKPKFNISMKHKDWLHPLIIKKSVQPIVASEEFSLICLDNKDKLDEIIEFFHKIHSWKLENGLVKLQDQAVEKLKIMKLWKDTYTAKPIFSSASESSVANINISSSSKNKEDEKKISKKKEHSNKGDPKDEENDYYELDSSEIESTDAFNLYKGGKNSKKKANK